ncbi:MAG: heparan-alpha-glucosaminide N-acetyltransferase domain-containing protein, partial [Candidatus Micrarchaeota archaeon]
MRFWNVDFLRGIAVIGMIAYNWAFALDYFGYSIPLIHTSFGWLLSRTVAFAFVFIAGISYTLIRGDAQARHAKRLDHGKKILFFAFLIT